MGDLVFELYHNHAPLSAENFTAYATGQNPLRLSYEGSTIDKGYSGLVISGGNLAPNNTGADGRRLADENTNLRHYKRGMLSLDNDGENAAGSKFLITLDKADMLDGYFTVIGELVEGDDVLSKIEKSLSRGGTFS